MTSLAHALPAQADALIENVKPFLAAADGLRWLTHQVQAARAKIWKDPPTRYFIGKVLSNNFFTLTFDAQGEWVLATYDMPAMQWFVELPWAKVRLRGGEQPIMSLVCPSINLPASPENNFKGGTVPPFGIDFQIAGRMARMLENDTSLRVGIFGLSGQDSTRITKAGDPLPLEVRGQERR